MSETTGKNADVKEKLSALITNTSAIRAITGAVEGTIGPRGLDTMLVDRNGDIIITNAGVTILDRMEVTHPAARMLINIARAQHEEIGDGTTTATIMSGALVSEGLDRIIKGVPVTRIIDGIREGVILAMEELKKRTTKIDFPDDPLLLQVALIAGRGHEEIAKNITEASRFMGKEKLMDPSFKLKDIVTGVEGADSEIFEGIIIKKRPVNPVVSKVFENPVIYCFDDSLKQEDPEEGSLATEKGLELHLKREKEFRQNLAKLIKTGVNVVFLTKGISDRAEEALTDAGILIVSRLTSRQMRRICDHTGATAMKKTGLNRTIETLQKYAGSAQKVLRDEKIKSIRIIKGRGKSAATVITGAPTMEVLEEKERIAKDAASAVQAAVRAGVVPGGGATELAISRSLENYRKTVQGMKSFGIDCVIEALRRPMTQIIKNAGFNPLEKIEEVLATQNRTGLDSIGIDCGTGEVIDMLKVPVADPTLVKLFALKAAGEVAEAILRINTIIRMKDPNNIDIENYALDYR